MTNYKINTETLQLTEDKGNLGYSFSQPPFRDATLQETTTYEFKVAKEKKIKELKDKRDEFKKTVVIKDDITLSDLSIATNNYENMKALKYGWTQSDLDLFDSEMDNIVNQYISFKSQIDTSESINDLQLISIIFNKK